MWFVDFHVTRHVFQVFLGDAWDKRVLINMLQLKCSVFSRESTQIGDYIGTFFTNIVTFERQDPYHVYNFIII